MKDTPAPEGAQTLTVLVVDDDADTVEEMQDIVDLEGWNAIIADDADRALEVFEVYQQISVVVTDFHFKHPSSTLPNGLELIKQVKALYPHLNLPFIVLSGDPDAAAPCKEAGAAAFISKPLDPDQLIDTINSVGVIPVTPAEADLSTLEMLHIVRGATQKLHEERTQETEETS